MKFLFFFIDGIGLGHDDPSRNPFARAAMPHLQNLLEGQRLVVDTIPSRTSYRGGIANVPNPQKAPQRVIHQHHRFENDRCTLLALDACLGVEGLPKSATGQAALLTGINMSSKLGYHQGPKPNDELAHLIQDNNLFKTLLNVGLKVTLLNAYPPVYFAGLDSGRRQQGVVAFAVTSAGIPLKTTSDLLAGKALSADFTGQGWRDQLGFPDIPQLEPSEAGEHLGMLAQEYDFTFFEYWLSDYVGHRHNMSSACTLLETFDKVLGGLLDVWDDDLGLILITSDHGNLEDLSTRRHTSNLVPALVIGAPQLRLPFAATLHDLTDVTPAILRLFGL
ncbi:MAG: hypothetical protein IIA61_05840 [Candidatus Marinimicrobia bacterium]|nr:hypothetical protein [Candidatus Neomarinimicrobiota bacterium]